MLLSADFAQLLTSLTCALSVGIAVKVALRRASKGKEVQVSNVQPEYVDHWYLGVPVFVKYMNRFVRYMIILASDWLLLHLDASDSELPTPQDMIRISHAPRMVPVDLPSLSPLLLSRPLVPLTPMDNALQLFFSPELDAPGAPWFTPQELSPLPLPQHFDWPSPTMPAERTLLELDGPESRSLDHDCHDPHMDDETETTFEDSPLLIKRDDIEVNILGDLIAEIVIHGLTYDHDALQNQLEYMKSQSDQRQQHINLNITVTCRKTPAVYDTITDILYTCKDHISSLSIVMGAHSTKYTSIGSQSLRTFTFPNLLHFSWSGDTRDLPEPWGSLSKLPFAQFESLVLDCPLSVTDCAQILSLCGRIVHFAATSVQDCPSVMPCNAIIKENNTLESLKISTSVEVDWLFSRINFNSMEKCDLQFTSGTDADLARPKIHGEKSQIN